MAKKKFNFMAADAAKDNVSGTVQEPETEHMESEASGTAQVQEALKKIETPINTAFNFKFVKRDKLVFHKNNDYPMESIEELADSILEYGLIHNLEVYHDIENDKYIIESGEQRTRAIDLLVERYRDIKDDGSREYKKFVKNVQPFLTHGYPCNIKASSDTDELNSDVDIDEIDSEIRVILANEIGRKKDAARTKIHIDRLNELYQKKNDALGRSEKINVNKEIGKQLNISDRQVQNYKAIDKLIPELREYFDKQNIKLTEGANYAKLTEEEQRQIYSMIESGDSKKEINAMAEQMNRMRLDIEKKENEISKLKKEQLDSENVINEYKEKSKNLRKEIEQELKASDPNEQRVKELQGELEKSNKELSLQKKALKETLKEQESKIKALKKQLDEKDAAKEVDTEFFKSEMQLNSSVEIITIELAKMKSALDVYKQKYVAGENTDPEEYVKKLELLLKNF